MIYLIIVTIIWGFSFGLIKDELSGIDPILVSFLRLMFSAFVFVPIMKFHQIKNQLKIKLIAIGAVQFGLMYTAYIYSYQYLQAYEVALFTILTPVYISIINDLIQRKLNPIYLLTAILSVTGAAVISLDTGKNIELTIGIILVQISNICFAFGQIAYRNTMQNNKLKDKDVFGWLYLGAVILLAVILPFRVSVSEISISGSQWLILIYLGVAASGLGFFLWNSGVRKVTTGMLAVVNNLKIPVAVAISIIIFGETADMTRFIIGGFIILSAMAINYKIDKSPNKVYKIR